MLQSQAFKMSQLLIWPFHLGFLISGVSSALFYYIFNRIWPVEIYPAGPHQNDSKSFEYMRPSEGYFEEDERIGEAFAHGIPVLDAEAGVSDVESHRVEEEKKI